MSTRTRARYHRRTIHFAEADAAFRPDGMARRTASGQAQSDKSFDQLAMDDSLNQPYSLARRPEVAEVVEEGFVEEIRDDRTGEIHKSPEFLRREVRELNILRAEQEDLLRADAPRFRCSHCAVGVTLRRSRLGRWHFRHAEEDGSCRYQTKGALSQDDFDARRYNGQKEGPEHIRMKGLIRDSLLADASFDQQSIREEVRWRGKVNPGTWKIPDIQATRNGTRIAFEIQLSSTYINVMRERRSFYLAEGGLLFWVLTRLREEDRRQFQDDILYPNNCNLFAIDEETRGLSHANSELTMRCGYLEPIREERQLRERWCERMVAFSELTVDLENQRVFYFDYEKARAEIERGLRTINGVSILDGFHELLRAKANQEGNVLDKWRTLKRTLPEEFTWPIDLYGEDFFTAVDIYLSARDGRPVGWNYDALIQSAHRCMDIRPDLLPFLEDCFKVFGRSAVFSDKRYSEKWERKRAKAVAEAIAKPDTKLHLNRLRHYRPAMEWLMPEIKRGIALTLAQLDVT